MSSQITVASQETAMEIPSAGTKFVHVPKKEFFAILKANDSAIGRSEMERRYDAYLNDYAAKVESGLAAAKAQGIIRAKSVKSSSSGRVLAVSYERVTKSPTATVQELQAEIAALRAKLAATEVPATEAPVAEQAVTA